jgi:lipopolysaccharide transport system ATP-binding protein
MKSIVIKAEGLSKKFRIGSYLSAGLRESIMNQWNILLGRKNQNYKEFWALDELDFQVQEGDVFGIIGKNGAGKSTLLKILSRITEPSKGRVEITGRVSSLLEVGTGFHPELTGRENIFLNGTILGMSKKEVRAKFDEIVEFSGVVKFIDTPVKHYSSGMYVRLAFSVAAHLEPEILIIDEVLAVGDAEFQKKCLGKIGEVASGGRTVLFVSHNMAAVKSLCNVGMSLANGKIISIGDINEVIQNYMDSGHLSAAYVPDPPMEAIDVAFKRISVQSKDFSECTEFTVDDTIIIEFEFVIRIEKHPYSVFVIIKDKYGSPVFSAERKIDKNNVKLKIEPRFLTRGFYSLHTFIHIPKVEQIDVARDICNFSVSDATSSLAIHGSYEYGNVFGNFEWE